MRKRSVRSATAGPARSTCMRCCRYRRRSWHWAQPIRRRLAWLAEHWGTTDRLRQVHERAKPRPGRRLSAGHAVVGYGFFTLGDTPDGAIARLSARWPALRFALRRRLLD